MAKRALVQKPTGNFLQWKCVDHRSSWERSDWPRNWSNPLRFDLHETLRSYQQQQNLHLIYRCFGSVWQKREGGSTWWLWWFYKRLSVRYGFYDQEGKLQVVNYSADPKGVNYFACHHFFPWSYKSGQKETWNISRNSMQRGNFLFSPSLFSMIMKKWTKSNKCDTFSGIPCRGWPCAKARILKNLKLSNFLFSVKMHCD